MKFRATFKTPDAITLAAKDAIYKEDEPSCCCNSWDGEGKECPTCNCNGNCIDCQRLADNLHDSFDDTVKMTEKFVAHGEYITIEFDTDNNTATVVEKGK